MRKIHDYRVKLSKLIHIGTHASALNVEEAPKHTCQNCGTEFKGNYCPGCGQSASISRLDVKEALENFMGVYANIERGVIHTCIDLAYRPGYMMYDYVKGHRVEYTKPIQLLFLLSTIYLVCHHVLFGQAGEADLSDLSPVTVQLSETTLAVLDFVKEVLTNKAYLSLCSVVILIIPYWLAFKKTEVGKTINLSEFFYVMVYVACLQLVYSTLCLPIDRLMGNDTSSGVGINVMFSVWAFHQFFRLSWAKTILHSIQGYFYLAIPVMFIFGIITLLQHFGIINS